jgi:hypothetical protein
MFCVEEVFSFNEDVWTLECGTILQRFGQRCPDIALNLF